MLVMASCSGQKIDDPRASGCLGQSWAVDRTRGDMKLEVSTDGDCTQADCASSGGSTCSGFFAHPGGACIVTVGVRGMGTCRADIVDPGCTKWIDIVATPTPQGLSCPTQIVDAMQGL
jgi:hypothetical protein